MKKLHNPPLHPGQRELFRVDRRGRVKTRTIYEPSDDVRERHDAMLRQLHAYDIPMPRAMGGVRGKGVIDNVLPHRQHDYFYLMDIASAYESVDIGELARVAHDSLYRMHARRSEIDEVVDFIENDAVIHGVPGLPTGYPASPYLFNLYCKPMDEVLGAGLGIREVFGQQAYAYTRWLDDLTFSSDAPFSPDERSWLREHVEATPGLQIAHHKSKLHSLDKGPVTITGLALYPDRRIQPSPDLIDDIDKTFRELQALLDQGRPLTKKQIGKLHGYSGVLHLGGDPRMSGSGVLVRLSNVHDSLTARVTGRAR